MSVLSVQSVSYSYKTKYQTVQAVQDVEVGRQRCFHYWQDWIRRRAET